MKFKIAIIVLVVIVLGAVAAYITLGANNDSQAPSLSFQKEARIKHLGVNIDYYDPVTNKAGDFDFSVQELHDNMLFMDYGYFIPASSASPDKYNPQPTFILPLGTPVHSLVDGVVVGVPELYSSDYSVQVQGDGSDLIFETEHVVNVTVQEGDRVKAGDVIAEVSPHDSNYNSGFGLVEIGILKAGNPPSHVCPFDYLDESIKDDLLAKIAALHNSWEEYKNDESIYDETEVVVPGCVTREEIEG